MKDETIYKAQKGEFGQYHFSTSAIALIGLGLFFLVLNLLGIGLLDLFWPGFVIGFGALLLWPAVKSTQTEQSSLSFLAVPGAVLVAVGVALFLMNLTGHWQSWAYSWVIVPAGAVYGLLYLKRFDKSSNVHQWGHRFLRAMTILGMSLAILFELLIFHSLGPWWPVVMVGLGLYLFARTHHS